MIWSCNPGVEVVEARGSARAAVARHTGSLKPVWTTGDTVSKNIWFDSASLELTVEAWNTQLCFSSQVPGLQCAPPHSASIIIKRAELDSVQKQ